MVSKVGICNMAISLVGGNRILSLDDPSDEAAICSTNFDRLRDLVLESADWTFATKRYMLLPEADAYDWGYAHQFTIPISEIVRVINVSDNPDFRNGDSTLDWRREGNVIVTDAEKIYVKAIAKVEDPAKFSAGFVDSLSLRLAAELAIPIPGSRSLRNDLLAQYQDSLNNSVSSENLQGKSDIINSKRYIRVR